MNDNLRTTRVERQLGDSLTTAMLLAMTLPRTETPMPCRAPALTLLNTDPEPMDEVRSLRTRIADLEDLLALIEATTDSADGGNIRKVLRQCLQDCRQRLLRTQNRALA